MSTDNFLDEDDDFGDFGGFEAAEPIDPQQAQPLPDGIQASPSPWALFPAGATTQGQTHAPDPSVESQVGKGQSVPVSQTADISRDAKAASSQVFQASSEIDVVKTSSEAGASPGFNADFSQAVNQSSDTSKLVGAFDDALAENEEDIPVSKSTPSEQSKPSDKSESPAQVEANNEASKHLTRLQEKLRLTEQDRTKLQKELEEVQGFQKQLQGELVQLHEQTARYEQMQSKHALQLDEMRKAGHDALVLIVEEYKELCKTAVLQQQESSQRDFQEYLKQERKKEDEKLRQREDEVAQVLENEKIKFEKSLQEELSKLEEKHKTELSSALKKENEKTEEIIKTAIESEKAKSTTSIEEAVQKERKKGQEELEAQKADFLKLLSEERENSKKEWEKCLDEERDKFKDSIKDAIQEERERGEKTQQKIRDQIKSELEGYVEKQKQEDLLVRKRQLTSMDLFLESARGQLKLLMTDSNDVKENSKP